MLTDLIIYQKTYDFMLWLHPIVNKFPKGQRFIVGQRIENKVLDHDLVPPRFMNRHHISPTHEHIDLVYFATADTDVVVQGENEKSDGIHWFSKEELLDPNLETKESMRYYALKALEEVGS